MLRFVTPYATEMEALVDVTPYSQMLLSSLSTLGKVFFYTEIDTWVGNDTNQSYLYVNNVTDQCSWGQTSDGNAWNVSVDLLIWHKSKKSRVDSATVRPKATVALASSVFDFGVVSVLNGTLQALQKQLTLDEATDFSLVAGQPAIYACPDGPEGLKSAAFRGFVSRQAEKAVAETAFGNGLGNQSVNQSAVKETLDNLQKEYTEMFTPMVPGQVVAAIHRPAGVFVMVNLSYDAELRKGMPVFWGSGVLTDSKYVTSLKSRWFNQSMPWRPFGTVHEVVNKTSFVMEVSRYQNCFAEDNVTNQPVVVPATPDALSSTAAKVKTVLRRGADAAGLRGEALEDIQFLDAVETSSGWVLTERRPIGYVMTTEQASNASLNASESTICVLKENRQGFVFTRHFDASLAKGDRALLQLTVTGHGWAATTEQCGEYCHAVYHLTIDGKSFANVTQWRADCDANPIGKKEHGTWEEHRNGWCPGSVEPGVFIDATDFLQSTAKHSLELHVTVWSNLSHRYKQYTDFSGFANSDKAVLSIASNIFIYGEDAVASARKKSKAFTKAEAALRDGSSDPQALKPPAVPRDLTEALLVEISPNKSIRSEKPKPCHKTKYDFEARWPWYFYNASKEGLPGALNHGVLVPILQDRWMQSNTRKIELAIEKQAMEAKAGPVSSWQQMALYFRLRKPTGKEVDHWDRRGSVGIKLPGNMDNLQVMKETASPETFRTWKVEIAEGI